MMMSFADLILFSNLSGFGLSLLLNILYNVIQPKDSRHKISFGAVVATGIFLSLVFGIYFICAGLGI